MTARSPWCRLAGTGSTLVLGALVALVLAACGSDGPDAPGGVGAAPAAAAPSADRPPSTDAATPSVDTDAGGPPTYPPTGEVVEVRSLDNTFRPEAIEVVAGTEVLWVNGGRNEHDVLPVDDDQTWGVEIESFRPGDEYSFVFDTPGTYRYYCSIHATKEAGMIGVVEVVAPS